jgi:hypothetical protein
MTCAVNVADLLRRSSVAQPVRVLRVIIAGSRGLAPNADAIHNAFDRWLEDEDIVPGEIVSGNARGVDRAGEDWAASVGLPIKRFPITQAEWRTYGKSAGPRRNMHMAVYADALLAFWDGLSRGTADMVSQMRDRGKPVRVVRIGGAP